MKTSLARLLASWAAILAFMTGAVAAGASNIGVLYSNGPVNGYVTGWNISGANIVSDSFTLGAPSCTGACFITGWSFGVWESPGDVLSSLDYSITSLPNGGTLYAGGTIGQPEGALSDTFLFNNNLGFEIHEITVSGLEINLGPGTYWLNLSKAETPAGDPVFWDQNSGVGCTGYDGIGGGCPSKAFSNGSTIPSEDPDIYGYSSAGTVPEPGTLLLFSSSIPILAIAWRRRRRT